MFCARGRLTARADDLSTERRDPDPDLRPARHGDRYPGRVCRAYVAWPWGEVRPAILVDHAAFYWAVLAVTALLAWLMWRFVRSPFGLTLQGIRDSESRMRSLGYDVSLHLFIGFTVSGLFAGIAGALYAFF